MNYEILVGDVLDGLAQLADNSVQVVVTSPPYFGLRDYQTGTWEGGSPDCEHKPPQRQPRNERPLGLLHPASDDTHAAKEVVIYRDTCPKCGARRIDKQIGLEPTLDEFLAKMVAVFREVRRVLRPDGTCWLNIGDSYAHNGACGGGSPVGEREYRKTDRQKQESMNYKVPAGLKPKDLMLVPFRLAIALQADGWFVRSDIIWQKPNPMPESCTDRPTTAHEHIFLLTKSGKYYYDQFATREKFADERMGNPGGGGHYARNVPRPNGTSDNHFLANGEWTKGAEQGGRNPRSVWSIPTFAFAAAHFATYPPELVRRCLLAGLPKHGSCPKCGKGWVRKVEKTGGTTGKDWNENRRGKSGGGEDIGKSPAISEAAKDGTYQVKSLGHEPDCDCGLDPVPAVVCDIFSGSGTTGVVALKMGARYIGIELSSEYAEMSRKRIEREAGGLFNFDANPSGSEPEAVTGVGGNSKSGGAV